MAVMKIIPQWNYCSSVVGLSILWHGMVVNWLLKYVCKVLSFTSECFLCEQNKYSNPVCFPGLFLIDSSFYSWRKTL